jgi:hypothetical protein
MSGRQKPATEARAPGSAPGTVGGSASARSRSFLRTQYWIWPLVAAVILVFVGVFVRVRMEAAMKALIAGNLQTILNANTEAALGGCAAAKGWNREQADGWWRKRSAAQNARTMEMLDLKPK